MAQQTNASSSLTGIARMANKSKPTILPQRKYLLTKMAVVNSSLWKQLLHGLIQTCIPAPTVSVSKPNQSTPISTNPSYTKFWLHPVKPTQERLNSELCMCTCIQHIIQSWLVGVEFNASLDTIQVISEAVFTANHLTDTDKQTVQENTDKQT